MNGITDEEWRVCKRIATWLTIFAVCTVLLCMVFGTAEAAHWVAGT